MLEAEEWKKNIIGKKWTPGKKCGQTASVKIFEALPKFFWES